MKWKNSLLCMAAMVLLAGVTCYILLRDHSMGTLWAVLKNADLRFVLLGLFLMVLFVGCEAAVIRLLAGTWGGSVPWKRAMQYSFAGFYFSSITPSSTGGQPMQLYYMVRDGMSAARSSFALLTITAMYQLAALTYGAVMGAAKFSYLMGLPLALKLLICFGILANGISVAFILLILFCRPLVERLVYRVIRLLNHIPSFDGEKAAQKAGSMIEEYSQGGAYLLPAHLPVYGILLCLSGPWPGQCRPGKLYYASVHRQSCGVGRSAARGGGGVGERLPGDVWRLLKFIPAPPRHGVEPGHQLLWLPRGQRPGGRLPPYREEGNAEKGKRGPKPGAGSNA